MPAARAIQSCLSWRSRSCSTSIGGSRCSTSARILSSSRTKVRASLLRKQHPRRARVGCLQSGEWRDRRAVVAVVVVVFVAVRRRLLFFWLRWALRSLTAVLSHLLKAMLALAYKYRLCTSRSHALLTLTLSTFEPHIQVSIFRILPRRLDGSCRSFSCMLWWK